jgi:hypothetical protein
VATSSISWTGRAVIHPRARGGQLAPQRTGGIATARNNVALAFIVAGFIAPAVTGQLQTGWHALVTGCKGAGRSARVTCPTGCPGLAAIYRREGTA